MLNWLKQNWLIVLVIVIVVIAGLTWWNKGRKNKDLATQKYLDDVRELELTTALAGDSGEGSIFPLGNS